MQLSQSSKIVPGLKGSMLASFGSLWIGVCIGLLIAAFFSILISGNNQQNIIIAMFKIAGGLAVPLLVLGPLHWYVMHSLISKCITGIAFIFGIWLWFSVVILHV